MTRRFRVTLRADDDAATRAQRIVDLLGWAGDPKMIAEQRAVIADALQVYMEIDGRAYDPSLDSFRSYDAAIAAIRAKREAQGV